MSEQLATITLRCSRLALTSESVSLVNYTDKTDLVRRCIVLETLVNGRCIDVRLTAALVCFFFTEKWPRSAALSFPTRSLGHCDLEKQIVGSHRGRQQSLGEGVVRAERHRDEFLELVIALRIDGGFQFRSQALDHVLAC